MNYLQVSYEEVQQENMELREEVMRLQVALANIAAIEKDANSDAFCEIDEAQAIANLALNGEDE